MSTYKRRRLIVGAFQVRLLLVNTAYLLIAGLLAGVAVIWPLMRPLYDPDASVVRREEAARELLTLHLRLWPGLIAFLLLFALHQVLFTHRIAGPMYRIRVTLRGMAKGVLPARIRLRRGDMLGDEADALNQLLSSLRGRLQRMRACQSELQLALDALSDRSTVADADAQRVRLQSALASLAGELDGFDLQDTGPASPREAAAPGPPAALPRGEPAGQSTSSRSTHDHDGA